MHTDETNRDFNNPYTHTNDEWWSFVAEQKTDTPSDISLFLYSGAVPSSFCSLFFFVSPPFISLLKERVSSPYKLLFQALVDLITKVAF